MRGSLPIFYDPSENPAFFPAAARDLPLSWPCVPAKRKVESTNQRTLQHGNQQWTVRESDARAVPGARHTSCLICESSDVVRRLWKFPTDWRSLSDDELWKLVNQSGL
jgi:hypothetical protein